MEINIYCDGASSFNGLPNAVAGWAWALLINEELIYKNSGRIEGGTSNQGELTAIIEALNFIKKHAKNLDYPITLYSDSSYCIKGITEWIYNWKKNNWYRNANQTAEVKNKELWQELDNLNSLLNIEWKWIKGHQKENSFNNYVDELARAQTKKIKGGYI